MAALTIRNVDDALRNQLRIRAAQHGVSMEEEARRILRDALTRAGTAPTPMGQRLLSRFGGTASISFTPPLHGRPHPRHLCGLRGPDAARHQLAVRIHAPAARAPSSTDLIATLPEHFAERANPV